MMEQAPGVQLSAAACAKWFGAGVVAIWVSIPAAIQTLVVLMALDYAMGLLRAVQLRELCSDVGWRGLRRKAATFLLVAAAHYLTRALKLPYDFGSTLAAAFAANEGISIVENAADIGVPVPPALLDVLVRARKLTGRGVSAKTVRQSAR